MHEGNPVMKRVAGLVLAAVIGGGLSGCAQTVKNHGYAPDDELLAEITADIESTNRFHLEKEHTGVLGVVLAY